jgi:hypothetical protein
VSQEWTISRRGFALGAAGMLGAGALAQALEWFAAAGEAAAQAALSPDDPGVRATMTALADTIVPGPAGGADARPGAVEAGCVEELYESFYGAAPTFPLIHQDLAVATPRVLRRPAAFDLGLPYADRERVLDDRMVATGEGGSNNLYLLYQGAAIIVYVAYYGTARSEAGPREIGFPPVSGGYWPRHSYGVRFRGMTRTGNPR